MSLYIRVSNDFYTHRKTLRLRAAIGDAANWVPPRLWAYAAQQQPDGIFDGYTAEELANLIGFTGDASSMLQALLKAGFLDSDPLRIHDWQEHNAYHHAYSQKARKAANARWYGKGQAAGPESPPLDSSSDTGKGNGKGQGKGKGDKHCLTHAPSIAGSHGHADSSSPLSSTPAPRITAERKPFISELKIQIDAIDAELVTLSDDLQYGGGTDKQRQRRTALKNRRKELNAQITGVPCT